MLVIILYYIIFNN